MPFELMTVTAAKLADVIVLSAKNRQPDENPGAKLSFEVERDNSALAGFDRSLKSFLFTDADTGAADQAELDGVEPVSDEPNLTGIGSHLKVLHWEQEMTGYKLVIDLGLGGKRSDLAIDDCTLSNWRIVPKQGGTCLIKLDVESADVSEAAFGKLAKLKSREIQITLRAPVVAQATLNPFHSPFPKHGRGANEPPPDEVLYQQPPKPKGDQRKPKDATDTFVAAHSKPAKKAVVAKRRGAAA